MKFPGQIVLLKFPQTNLRAGKLRPALLVCRTPSQYDDWLVCLISTQAKQYLEGIDIILREEDPDFVESGLHGWSVIRVTRLAVVSEKMFLGPLGKIGKPMLQRVREAISAWILGGT
jgi:mRNA interferase MazF